MTTMALRRTAAALAALALAASAAACGKAGGGGGGGGQGGVKTGRGVTASTITLGSLTDLHGEFAAAGQSSTLGNRLYWQDVNAKGGICGRKVKLVVKDHGYDVQQAVTFYSQIRNQVLGVEQSLGSPMTTALSPQFQQDTMLAIPASWASTLLTNPDIMIVGSTYDVEMINGVDYLMSKGLLHPGDTVGHIYQEGEYGEDGLLGTEYAAKQNRLKLIPQKIKPTDNDVSAQVTNLKNAGAKAIFITTGPTQLASAASSAAALKYNVPILGNNPVFAPGLMTTSAASALEKNAYIMGSWLSPSAEANPTVNKLVQQVKQNHPNVPLQVSLVWGYGSAEAFGKVLKQACANKDLTPQGVSQAFRSQSNINTGIIAPLNYTKKGAPPSLKAYVFRPSKSATGGLTRITKSLYQGKDASSYTPPALKKS